MPLDPTVSIIIPCYNYAHLLSDTINNIKEQTFKNWECIIVDDGSTDRTEELVKSVSVKDPRVKYFKQKNAGPGVARNLGLKNANGQYIQFLDADDLLESKKLEHQLKIFEENPEADIVYGTAKFFKGTGNEVEFVPSPEKVKSPEGKGEVMSLALLAGNFIVISAPLTKSTVFKRYGIFDETLRYNEDWELWLRFALNGVVYKYTSLENSSTLIRIHSSSHSRNVFNMYLYGLLACIKFEPQLNDKRFKKILIPKIDYHKKILDKELLVILKADRKLAVEKAGLTYQLSHIARYKRYAVFFRLMPYFACFVLTRIYFITCKIKNMLVYA